MAEETIIPAGFKLCECGQCNELIKIGLTTKRKLRRFKWGHNRGGLPVHPNSVRKGEQNNKWKGGRILDKTTGYVWIRKPDHPRSKSMHGYVLEHILVMEKHLGRYLFHGEVVHHKNGIRDDNRHENLELYSSHSEHMRMHMLEWWAKRKALKELGSK